MYRAKPKNSQVKNKNEMGSYINPYLSKLLFHLFLPPTIIVTPTIMNTTEQPQSLSEMSEFSRSTILHNNLPIIALFFSLSLSFFRV